MVPVQHQQPAAGRGVLAYVENRRDRRELGGCFNELVSVVPDVVHLDSTRAGELGSVLLHDVPDFLARRREINLPARRQRHDSLERPLGQRAVAGREDGQSVDVVLV